MIEIALHHRVALLIDADNIDLSKMNLVLKLSAYFGAIQVCRAYGDWQQNPLKSHKRNLDELGIETKQVNRNGKEATDRWLLLEVGNLLGESLFGSNIDKYIILSGDGGFVAASEYIKENGRQVIGIANKEKTSSELIGSCDQFYFIENLSEEIFELEQRYPIPPDMVRAFHVPLIIAYHKCTGSSKDYSWVSFSQLGSKLHEIYSDYESRLGEYQLSTWLEHYKRDFLTEDQMIRRIDANPELARRNHLVTAYIETRDDEGLASLSDFGKKLREVARDYEEQFSAKRLSEWIREYPDDFEIRDGFVIYVA